MSKRRKRKYNRRRRYTTVNSPCKVTKLQKQLGQADRVKPLVEMVKELNALLTERKASYEA